MDKKFICLIMTVIMFLVACGSGTNSATQSNTATVPDNRQDAQNNDNEVVPDNRQDAQNNDAGSLPNNDISKTNIVDSKSKCHGQCILVNGKAVFLESIDSSGFIGTNKNYNAYKDHMQKRKAGIYRFVRSRGAALYISKDNQFVVPFFRSGWGAKPSTTEDIKIAQQIAANNRPGTNLKTEIGQLYYVGKYIAYNQKKKLLGDYENILLKADFRQKTVAIKYNVVMRYNTNRRFNSVNSADADQKGVFTQGNKFKYGDGDDENQYNGRGEFYSQTRTSSDIRNKVYKVVGSDKKGYTTRVFEAYAHRPLIKNGSK